MHMNGRGWKTAEVLPRIVLHLRKRGFTLVTVSELLGRPPAPPIGGAPALRD
jgi:peptidoglycan/xylan/chitin deacetylase (PgdA/CDA1 family)